jgi:alkylated DNA nucleotide flippase Atl1
VDEGYVELVLAAVESIPAGRVATYGEVAAFVGYGGPRQVGQVMSRYGAAVCWWRVVRADGQPARGHEAPALARLRSEGTPLRGDRIDLRQARMRDSWAGNEDVTISSVTTK